jgi:hypothetical protein
MCFLLVHITVYSRFQADRAIFLLRRSTSTSAQAPAEACIQFYALLVPLCHYVYLSFQTKINRKMTI